MSKWLAEVFHTAATGMDVELWLEPFGGGAGAALMALDRHDVPEAWICETNVALAAFWQEVMDNGESFARRVASTTPALPSFWHARDTVATALAGEVIDRGDLAFAAFVLNRCSRSGMVTGNVGPIGGKKQAGRYSVASRWNGTALAERIRTVSSFGSRLQIRAGDGIAHIEDLAGSGVEDEVFIFADPPYIGVGNRLYAAGMDDDGHRRLAEALRGCPSPWVLTYDAHPDVLALYPGFAVREFAIPHAANRQGIGTEYLVAPGRLVLPEGNPLGRGPMKSIVQMD
jgi:DNA adenine methylase